MVDLAELMTQFLMDCCYNESTEFPGWNEYGFESHCVSYKVIARNIGDRKYEILQWTYSND